jgi:hypothetical protein
MIRQVRLNSALLSCLLLLLCTQRQRKALLFRGTHASRRVRERKTSDAGSWPTIPWVNSQNRECSFISMRIQHASRPKQTRGRVAERT